MAQGLKIDLFIIYRTTALDRFQVARLRLVKGRQNMVDVTLVRNIASGLYVVQLLGLVWRGRA